MTYWQAKSDLVFIRNFKKIAHEFMGIKFMADDLQNGNLQREFSDLWGDITPEGQKFIEKFNPEYTNRRQRFVKAISRSSSLAYRYNVPCIISLGPPPLIGGYPLKIDTFHALLEELPWGATIDPQRVIDVIDQTENACENQVNIERRHLYNPFYWFFIVVTFILRIPFLLIKTSGFNVEKFEDQFWGRLFKLGELIGLVLLLRHWGVKPEIWIKDVIAALR